MDQFIINKFWLDCFHAQIAQCSTVETAVSHANFAARAYRAWVEGLDKTDGAEDAPLEKKAYCGDLLSDHEWRGDGHDEPFCLHCDSSYEDIECSDIHYPYKEEDFCSHCSSLRQEMRSTANRVQELQERIDKIIG